MIIDFVSLWQLYDDGITQKNQKQNQNQKFGMETNVEHEVL